MKHRNYLAGFLVAILALSACTNEALLPNQDPQPEQETAGKLTLKIKGATLASGSQTRSATQIATPEETEIESMILLLVGGEENSGSFDYSTTKVYEYRKDWGGDTPGADVTKLELIQTQDATVMQTNIDMTGLMTGFAKPAVQLHAYVNGMTFHYKGTTDPVIVKTPMTAVEIAALTADQKREFLHPNGIEKNPYQLGWMGHDDLTAPITGVLPMMGGSFYTAALAPINTVSIEIKRTVARFDIRNNRSENLRIGAARVMQVKKGFGYEKELIDMQEVSLLPITDPGSNWENVPTEITSAFYSLAGTEEFDLGIRNYILLETKVKEEGQWIDKQFKIVPEIDGKFIKFEENTRYVLNIQDVEDDIITAFITVAKWVEGEWIDGGLSDNVIDSRKLPTLTRDVTDDLTNGVIWRMDGTNAELPSWATFRTIEDGKKLTLLTLAEKKIAAGATDDEPEVQIDITSASGNNEDVWLTQTSAVGADANVGKTVHTLTVDLKGKIQTPDLFVKIKNKAFPEKCRTLTISGCTSSKAPALSAVSSAGVEWIMDGIDPNKPISIVMENNSHLYVAVDTQMDRGNGVMDDLAVEVEVFPTDEGQPQWLSLSLENNGSVKPVVGTDKYKGKLLYRFGTTGRGENKNSQTIKVTNKNFPDQATTITVTLK